MDVPGDGIPPLTSPAYIDLHAHSTASDGDMPPAAVVRRAREASLSALALTDHDTLAGLPEAIAAGAAEGVTIVAGCEFSVAAEWGEMHVLGYFLPADHPELEAFLRECRHDRERRAEEMVAKLTRLGVPVTVDDVKAVAGGALGRPHVARAIVAREGAADISQAFDRYLGRGRPAFVAKRLPAFADVAGLVRRIGGVVSAAHLKDRGTRERLRRLRGEGLDAVETRHPRHSADQRARLTSLAKELDLLRTGGSDWHGDSMAYGKHDALGSQSVPAEWLAPLAELAAARAVRVG